jgi:hypothetical protein
MGQAAILGEETARYNLGISELEKILSLEQRSIS